MRYEGRGQPGIADVYSGP